jgi:hypothetical protein
MHEWMDDDMTKVVLDANIWDKLAKDSEACERIRSMCEAAQLEVVVPDTLLRELEVSPFGGVPDWFPTQLTSDNVFVCDHSRLGSARLGDGEIFSAHRGDSKKVSDAVIVDAADSDANVFVSEDRRARERYVMLRDRSKSLDYARFRSELLRLT